MRITGVYRLSEGGALIRSRGAASEPSDEAVKLPRICAAWRLVLDGDVSFSPLQVLVYKVALMLSSFSPYYKVLRAPGGFRIV